MFLFALCQTGAEKVLKQELSNSGNFRLAFSRPGFVSFKMPEEFCSSDTLTEDIAALAAESVFARTIALSLGKANGIAPLQLSKDIWDIAVKSRYFINRVNVCGRGTPLYSTALSGTESFEPAAIQQETRLQETVSQQRKLHRIITENSPAPKFLAKNAFDSAAASQSGETVLDVVQVEREQYFIGVHRIIEASPLPVRYSGGIIPLVLPEDAVSRAYLKFEEGLRWSGFPLGKNSRCADIGASPGGGSQVLLSRGASVIGIDPGEMAPAVLANPKFKHIRSKINQVKHSVFNNVHWLIADMNVAPNYTLDVLEDIALRDNSGIKGMLFTLKLFQWELAADIPSYIKRIHSWEYGNVRVRQLAFNRQEVMVAAKR